MAYTADKLKRPQFLPVDAADLAGDARRDALRRRKLAMRYAPFSKKGMMLLGAAQEREQADAILQARRDAEERRLAMEESQAAQESQRAEARDAREVAAEEALRNYRNRALKLAEEQEQRLRSAEERRQTPKRPKPNVDALLKKYGVK